MPRVRILLIASLSLQLQGFVWCKGKSGIYYDNGIGQTVPDEDGEMEEIQEDILTVLGLHHKPHPDASVTHGVDASASRFLLDLYRNFQDEEDATGDAKVRTRRELNMSETDMEIIEGSDSIMTFVNHGHHLSHVRHEKERRLWFDVSGIPLDEELKRAELRIFKEPGCKGNPDDTQPYVLILYKLIQGKYAQEMRLEYVDSKNTTLKEEGWLTFNVTETVKTWSVFPSENLGFYLLISGPSREADIRPSHIGIVNGGDMRRESFLLAYLSSISGVQLHARRTRAAKKNKRKTRNKDRNDYDAWDPSAVYGGNYVDRNCKKHMLYVSFRDLGWQDWIIAPDGYAAFYCAGECDFPLNAHMNASNHAIVQTLMHLMAPSKAPKPCCAPTKVSPISVLYFDDDSNVILKKYRNMVVKTCGCH